MTGKPILGLAPDVVLRLNFIFENLRVSLKALIFKHVNLQIALTIWSGSNWLVQNLKTKCVRRSMKLVSGWSFCNLAVIHRIFPKELIDTADTWFYDPIYHLFSGESKIEF